MIKLCENQRLLWSAALQQEAAGAEVWGGGLAHGLHSTDAWFSFTKQEGQTRSKLLMHTEPRQIHAQLKRSSS